MKHFFYIMLVNLCLLFFCKSTIEKSVGDRNPVGMYLIDSVRLPTLDSMAYLPTYVGLDYYYAIDAKKRTLLKFDRQGNLVSQMNRFGTGPEEYAQVIGFYPVKADVVTVMTPQNLKTYDWRGNLLSQQILSEKLIFQSAGTRASGDGNHLYTLAFDPTLSAEKMEFFEKSCNIASINIHTGKVNKVGYYFNGSVYRQYRFPTLLDPIFDVHKNDLYSLLPLDQTIFKVNLSTQVVKMINLDYTHFSKLYHKDSEAIHDQLMILQKNAKNGAIKVSNKYIITEYKEAIPDDYIKTDIFQLNSSTYRAKRYWNIFSPLSGVKLNDQDILAPGNHYNFLGFTNDSTLYIQGSVPNDTNEIQPYDVYVYKYIISTAKPISAN